MKRFAISNQLRYSLISVGFLLIVGCLPATQVDHGLTSQKTQLEKRQPQTHEYDTQDRKMVMKALLNVLQDEGFDVTEINAELCFVKAQKQIDKSDGLWTVLVDTRYASYPQAYIYASGNVSEFGKRTRVRVSFNITTFDSIGTNITKPMEAPQYYQDFFSKVSKEMFIQKEGI